MYPPCELAECGLAVRGELQCTHLANWLNVYQLLVENYSVPTLRTSWMWISRSWRITVYPPCELAEYGPAISEELQCTHLANWMNVDKLFVKNYSVPTLRTGWMWTSCSWRITEYSPWGLAEYGLAISEELQRTVPVPTLRTGWMWTSCSWRESRSRARNSWQSCWRNPLNWEWLSDRVS